MNTKEKLEAFFNEDHRFKKQLIILREIILKTPLKEDFKWRIPTYTYQGKNVLSIGKFKNHYGIWFFNGVFLKDPNKVLFNAQEGKTHSMRQWKFTPNDKIHQETIISYCQEAITNEEKGLKFIPKKKETNPLIVPELLQKTLDANNKLREAFNKLTPYKQKEYALHISDAKRETTKKARLIKITSMIVDGKGLHDKYKNC